MHALRKEKKRIEYDIDILSRQHDKCFEVGEKQRNWSQIILAASHKRNIKDKQEELKCLVTNMSEKQAEFKSMA